MSMAIMEIMNKGVVAMTNALYLASLFLIKLMLEPYSNVANTTINTYLISVKAGVLESAPATYILPMIMAKAPKKPIMTPINLVLGSTSFVTTTAMIKVKIGVMAFSIPANELLICCCAIANRNAGIPLPIKPANKAYFRSFGSIRLKCFSTNGKKHQSTHRYSIGSHLNRRHYFKSFFH